MDGDDEKFSGKLFVRVSPSLHRSVANRASREGVSMSQWVAERLAYSLGESQEGREGPSDGELLLVAKAMWEGKDPPEGVEISKESASLLLDKLIETIPGIVEFASKALELGIARQAFDLGNDLSLPRLSLAELQNEITLKFSDMEKARPKLPYGYESRSMGSTLGLFAGLLIRSGRKLEDLEEPRVF